MKLNNKGFATTAIMYSILTLILMLLLGSMAYLANRKKVLDKIKQDTYNEVNEINYADLSDEDFDYTGDYQEYRVMRPGYYKVELWGASGYSSQGGYGKGGYTSGYIHLTGGEKLYIYVGDNSNCSTGYTFNGGGCGEAVGGGATDVRYFGNTTPTAAQLAWDSELGLNSRIMVAAGGGGGVYNNVTVTSVGNGGGLIGDTPVNNLTNNLGHGGTPTAGGATGTEGYYTYETNMDGSFGKGGYMTGRASGGGGGYFGGGHGRHPSNSWSGGGGGSSFISGYAGSNAITSSTSRTVTNNTIHYSGKYFIGGVMKSGVNNSKGHAKITFVGQTLERKDTRLNNVRYIKDCVYGNNSDSINRWNELQAIKNGVNIAKGKTATLPSGTLANIGRITDGDIGTAGGTDANGSAQCIVVDLGQAYNLDEIAVWYNWHSAYSGVKTPNLSVSSDNSTWTTIHSGSDKATSQGKRVNAYTINSVEYNYSGTQQTFTAPANGYYKLEAYGAQGGNSASKGAYTSGYIYLDKNTNLYIYVGEGLNITGNSTTFNGGTGNQGGYGAGGATDFRLTSGAWNNSTSINSRIMVAAGSGSGSGNNTTALGAGGALFGLAGGGTQGGTQTTFGAIQHSSYTVSSFGIANGGCAGGNGYYPGGGSTCANGAGGGSSFISGYAGVNAITSASSTAASNNTIHYSGKYFLGGIMKAGNELMPTYDGKSTMIGNTGNGFAKVSYIGESLERVNTKLNNVRYIKDCTSGSSANASNHWVELQAIKNGVNLAKGKTATGITNNTGKPIVNITDGDLTTANYAEGGANAPTCITIDLGQAYDLDEIAVWHYWGDIRTYNNHQMSVSANNSNWITIMSNKEPETSEGMRVNAYVINDESFDYTGNIQSYTVPKTGTYRLETWGAAGGTIDSIGGKGGYSSGDVYLTAGTNLFIGVGGKGVGSTNSSSAAGYNGGGSASSTYTQGNNHIYKAGSGGGATHIAMNNNRGTLKDYSSNQSEVLIVAGGGGGAGGCKDCTIYAGGSGGGITGVNGTDAWLTSGSPTTGSKGATGGTQTRQGIGRFEGGFGYGASSGCNGGAGGGWYGGAAGTYGSAGGGSGYIGPYLTDKYMVCYNCTANTNVTNKTITNTCNSVVPKPDCAKNDNGFARITYLGNY